MTALLAVAIVAGGMTLLASPAAASHGGDHLTVDDDGPSDYDSIQAAINAAADGTVIEVADGVYAESLTVDVADLVLRATNDQGATIELSASGDDIDVTASGVTIDGFRIEWTGSSTTEADLVVVSGDGATVRDNLLVGSADPSSDGILVDGADSVDVTDNTVRQSNVGINVVRSANSRLAGNTLEDLPTSSSGGPSAGITLLLGTGHTLEDNTVQNAAKGLLVSSATDVSSSGDTFQVDETAVQVIQKTDADPQPTSLELRRADLSAAAISLELGADTQDLEVDARWNHWGLLGEQAIEETRVDDQGASNDVLVHPYLDANGDQYPPEPAVWCFTDDDGDGFATLSQVAEATTLQNAVDLTLPSECVDRDDDGVVHRTVIVEPSFEEYHGATIATKVTLLSNNTQAVDNVATDGALDFGARIQANQGSPALHFVEGSQDSHIEGVGLQGEPVNTRAILAEDITGDSGITIQDAGIGVREAGHSNALELRNVEGFTVTSSTMAAGDLPVVLENTQDTLIEDSRILFGTPGINDARGVLLSGTQDTVLSSNTVIGNQGDASHGIAAQAASQPAVDDNIVADAAVGLYLDTSTGAEVTDNSFVSPSRDVFAQQNYGVSTHEGADHTLERNTFQNAGQGIRVGNTIGVTADLNRFNATETGVYVRGLAEDSRDGVTDLALNNGTKATTIEPLVLTDTTENLDVDAECNDWGVYTNDTVEARVTDEGTNNDVDAQPFTSPNKNSGEIECLVPPKAAFSFAPDSPVTRLDTVDFTDESEPGTYDITDWSWDFDDGTTSTETDPSHSYDQVGEFFVELTVSDRVNMTSSKVHRIEVENIEPVLDPIGDIEVHHTEDAAFSASASDAEHDDLSFEAYLVDDNDQLQPLPTGASFSTGDDTATFYWDPAPDQYGVYDIRVIVDDGYDQVSEDLTITVNNEAPIFDPVLPDVRGGAIDRNVTLDVNALDPDVEDEITNLAIDVTDIPATEDEVWTLGSDGTSGRFNWTPETGEEGTYTISFTAESPGQTTTVPVTLDIRTDNSAPTIDAQASKASFVDGETAKVSLFADDPEGDEVNWSVVTPEAIDEDDTTLTELSDQSADAKWTWDIPENQTGSHEVTFVADDGYGEIDTVESVVITTSPWVEDRLPIETETGVSTPSPLAGSTVLLSFWAEDPDGTLTASDISLELDDGTSLSVSSQSSDAPLWGAEHEFTSPQQDITATIEVTDADGLVATEQVTFDVAPNAPPEVTVDPSVVWANATAPDGKAAVDLSGLAEDPEGRQLVDGDYAWILSGVTIASGPEASVELPLGTHHVDLVVTDPVDDTSTAVETLTVHVDDSIDVDGELDAEQTSEGHYRVDQVKHSTDAIEGLVSVNDDLGDPVDGAYVTGTVYYHGAEATDNGVPVASFEVVTNSDGEREFSYDQELAGLAPGDEAPALLSAPGWHEIALTASASSRGGGPSPDIERATDTIAYWVAPSQGTATPLAVTSVEGEGACFYDGQGAEDSGHIAFDGELDTSTPEMGNAMEALEACAAGLTNGELPEGGSYVALTGTTAGGVLVVEASTVPASDSVAEGELGPTEIQGQGACYNGDDGAEDESSVRVQSWEPSDSFLGLVLEPIRNADGPDQAAVAEALDACVDAVLAGSGPSGGSHARFTVDVGGSLVTVTVDTVPATNAIT